MKVGDLVAFSGFRVRMMDIKNPEKYGLVKEIKKNHPRRSDTVALVQWCDGLFVGEWISINWLVVISEAIQ